MIVAMIILLATILNMLANLFYVTMVSKPWPKIPTVLNVLPKIKKATVFLRTVLKNTNINTIVYDKKIVA